MEEEFLEYIKEEIKYIVTESSKERIETAKYRLLEEYINKLIICMSIHLLLGIISQKDLLLLIQKQILLKRSSVYNGCFLNCDKAIFLNGILDYLSKEKLLDIFKEKWGNYWEPLLEKD